MKNNILHIATAAALLAVSSASFGAASQSDANRIANQAMGTSGNVRVHIEGDIATVAGWVETHSDEVRVLNAVSGIDGVSAVRDLVFTSH